MCTPLGAQGALPVFGGLERPSDEPARNRDDDNSNNCDLFPFSAITRFTVVIDISAYCILS